VDNLKHSDDDVFKVISFSGVFELQWEEPLDVINSAANSGSIFGTDSDSSVCYTWRDSDTSRDNINELWGQRIGLNGERLWDERGRAINSRGHRHSAATDCNGGVITNVDFNFPALQVMNRNGEIGVVLDRVGIGDDRGFNGRPNPKPQLNVYPNPGNSYLHVKLTPVLPNEIFMCQIYDLMGRSVTAGTIRGFPYLVKDLSDFSSGDYILRLQSSRMTVAQKFSLVK